MKCKFHPTQDATHFCESCGVPICDIDAEEVNPGDFYCFQCAMLQTVSGVGKSLKEKRVRAEERKLGKKEKRIRLTWFHYFLLTSSMLILTMWSVILFAGPKEPAQRAKLAENNRVLLFIVDNGIRRYAHYEGGRYPEYLIDLVPKYVRLEKDQVDVLDKLDYSTDPDDGYRLSLARSSPGEMKITFTANGIEYEASETGGS